MKIRVNNKKVLIVMLIIFMLMLAVGYAVFSETLTISGTANAKGTFDLEFQNAEVVKNVGADKEKTTAEISADKNTLIVNAADLAYPGAGVEFSVDIVNVGTIPAEVQAVTPMNITGSDKIKVTGLDGIKVGHPKIEVGDRCNIHFTVKWPEDAIEISEDESSINFELQIEYVQATGEKFDGQTLHEDTDIEGNMVNTNTSTNTSADTNTITNTVPGGEEEQPEEPKEEPILNQITAEDYGKSVNYKATVNGKEVTNWKLLYKDENNTYLILDDYLPTSLVPSASKLSKKGTYVVYSTSNRDTLLNGLTTESYWSEFANGVEGATAQGSPSFSIMMKSYNEKYSKSYNTDPTIRNAGTFITTDKLYVPHSSDYEDVGAYWFADIYDHPQKATTLWNISCYGLTSGASYNNISSGIRPVVTLPKNVSGTIGDTIELK